MSVASYWKDARPLAGTVWSNVSSGTPWPERSGHWSVRAGGRVLVMGGASAAGTMFEDVWSSEDDGETWNLVTSDAGWGPRVQAAAAVVVVEGVERVIVAGGNDGESDLNDSWISDDGGATWSLGSGSCGWSGRRGHSLACGAGGSVAVLVGGEQGDGGSPTLFADSWRTSDGISWAQSSSSAGWAARSMHGHACLASGAHFIACGSIADGEYASDMWTSSNYGTTWSNVPGWNPGAGLSGVGMCATLYDSSYLYVSGGRLSDGSYSNDVWRSTNAGSTWALLSGDARWAGRANYGLVSSSSPYLLILGGELDAGRVNNEVWRLHEGASPAVWNRLSSNEFMAGRSGFSLCAVGESALVVGGQSATSNLSDVWRSNDSGRNWYRLHVATDVGVRYHHACAAALDTGVVFVAGGSTSGATRTNDVWRSADVGATWTRVVSAASWSARRHHQMVCTTVSSGGATLYRLLVLGGLSTSTLNDVWYSDSASASSGSFGQTWTQMSLSGHWAARRQHGAAVVPTGSGGSRVVVVGGLSSAGAQLRDVWSSADGGASWTQLTATGPQVHAMGICVRPSSSGPHTLFVCGGNNQSTGAASNSVFVSSDYGQTWSSAITAEWSARHSLQSTVCTAVEDGVTSYRTLVVGGTAALGAMNDVWYTQSASGDGWVSESPNGKAGRLRGAMCRLPTGEVFLLGGSNGSVPMNDVWMSVDDGVIWSLVAETAEWAARQGHVAVSTPTSAMLVIGGLADGALAMDVWANRAEDAGSRGEAWLESAATGGSAPAARWGHAAAALPTGVVVVCGGAVAGGSRVSDVWVLQSADGWATCTWTQKTGAAGWAARSEHCLVRVAGASSNMLVLGGRSDPSGAPLSDVWFTADLGASWTSILTSAPWPARYGHVCVLMPDDSLFLNGGLNGAGEFLSDSWRSEDGNGGSWALQELFSPGADSPGVRAHHTGVALANGVLLVDGIGDGAIRNDSWTSNVGWSYAQSPQFLRRPGTDLTRINLGPSSSDYISVCRSAVSTTEPTTVPAGSVLWVARFKSRWSASLASQVVARLRVSTSYFSCEEGSAPGFDMVVRFCADAAHVLPGTGLVQETSQAQVDATASACVCQIAFGESDAFVVVQEGRYTVTTSGSTTTTTLGPVFGPNDAMTGTKFVEIGFRPRLGLSTSLVVDAPVEGELVRVDSISPPRWAGVRAISDMEASSVYTPVHKIETAENVMDAPMVFHSTDTQFRYRYADTLSGSGVVGLSGPRRADWLATVDMITFGLGVINSEFIVAAPFGDVLYDEEPRAFRFVRSGVSATRTIFQYPDDSYVFPVPSSGEASFLFSQRTSAENSAGAQGSLAMYSTMRGADSDGADVLSSVVRFSPSTTGFAGGDPHVWSLGGVYTLPCRAMSISFLDTLRALGHGKRIGINCTADFLTTDQVQRAARREKRPAQAARQLMNMTFWGVVFAWRTDGAASAMVAIHAESLHVLAARGAVRLDDGSADGSSRDDALICLGEPRLADMPNPSFPAQRMRSGTTRARALVFPRVFDGNMPLGLRICADPDAFPYDRTSIEIDFSISMKHGIAFPTTALRACHGAIVGPDKFDSLQRVFDVRDVEQIAVDTARRVPDRWAVDDSGRHVLVASA